MTALFLAALLAWPASAEGNPAEGKTHLAQAEALERSGQFYEAAQEAQKAFWLDPALKPQADALLARINGGKGPGGRAPSRASRWALGILVVMGGLELLRRLKARPIC